MLMDCNRSVKDFKHILKWFKGHLIDFKRILNNKNNISEFRAF